MNFAVDLGSVHEQARLMDRSQWEAVWLEAADGGPVSVPLPAMPPQDIQVITNGKFGSPTMAGAARLLSIVEDEVAARVSPDTGQSAPARLRRRLGTHYPPLPAFLRTPEHQRGRRRRASGRLRRGTAARPRLPAHRQRREASLSRRHLRRRRGQLGLLASLRRTPDPDALRAQPGHQARRATSPDHPELRPLRALAAIRSAPASGSEGVLGEESAVQARLAKGELVFGATGKWPDYGIAVMPEGWTAANWGRANLEVLGSRDDYHQQVQLARPTRLQPRQSDKRGE